jgi:hypothetical protein
MIQMIVDLAGCSAEDAERVYAQVGNIPDAVDILMPKTVLSADKHIQKLKPKQEVTEEQKWCRTVREVLKTMDDKRSTSVGQREPEERSSNCIPLEETAQQNSCFQECQLPSHQSEAQIQETACPSQSECSSDLQSTVQK